MCLHEPHPITDDEAAAALPTLQQEWELRGSPEGVATMNLAVSFRLLGPLDVTILQRAFDEIIRRHEALRTYVTHDSGEVVQVIVPPFDVPIAHHDLRQLPPRQRWRRVVRTVTEQLREPFHLGRLPQLRPSIHRVGEHDHCFVIVMAHAIWDASSALVFRRELTELYRAFLDGRPSPLAPLQAQRADLAVLERESPLPGQHADWKQRLASFPRAIDLPRRPAAAPGYRPALVRVPMIFPWAITRLNALARECHASPMAPVLAAVFALVHDASRQDRLVIGLHHTSRDRPERHDVIGLLAENLLVAIDLADSPTFRALTVRVRDAALDLYARGLTMGAIFPESEGRGPWADHSTCDATFNYLDGAIIDRKAHTAGPVTVLPLRLPVWQFLYAVPRVWDYALLDFSIQPLGPGRGMYGRFGCNAAAVPTDLIIGLARDFTRFLRLAALRPDWRLEALLDRVREWRTSLPAAAFAWDSPAPGLPADARSAQPVPAVAGRTLSPVR